MTGSILTTNSVAIIVSEQELRKVEKNLALLAETGTHIVIYAEADKLPPALQRAPTERVRLETIVAEYTGVRAVIRSSITRLRGQQNISATLRDLLRSSDSTLTVLALGECASKLANEMASKRGSTRVLTGDAARNALSSLAAEAERSLLERMDRSMRGRKFSRARRLARCYRHVSPEVQAIIEALLCAVKVSEEGNAGDNFADVLESVFTSADVLWGRGEIGLATHALAAGVRLLFHRELHADVESTPLATTPREYLTPLYSSTMFRSIISDSVRERPHRTSDEGVRPDPPHTRVTVLPGAYPVFAAPLIRVLENLPNTIVKTLDLGQVDKRFRWLGPNTQALAWRVAAHPQGAQAAEIGGDMSAHGELLKDSDVVIADWGDRGAMWASTVVPEHVRLVVRLHGNDVFSSWIHFINWSRVSDLIVVSAPLGDLVQRVLGDRLAGVRVYVVEHTADPQRFTATPRADADRTLGMVGWGKVVKDPAWALDVLEQLCQEDDRWRLLLVGHPLEREGSVRTRDYAQAVWQRIEGTLAPHVELVSFTDDVPAYTAKMGFILSTSRRESFHLAVLEGALSGAVPVVRNWPIYSGGLGAEGIYPGDWIVNNPAEAAARILELRDPGDRQTAGTRARAQAIDEFSPEKFATEIENIIAHPYPREMM